MICPHSLKVIFDSVFSGAWLQPITPALKGFGFGAFWIWGFRMLKVHNQEGPFTDLEASVISQTKAGVIQGEEREKSSLKRLRAFDKWWGVAEPREQGSTEEAFPSQRYTGTPCLRKMGRGAGLTLW